MKYAEDIGLVPTARWTNVLTGGGDGLMGAATLGHELNQPLAAIGAYAAACERQLACGVGDVRELREMLAEISVQVRRAGEILWRARESVKKDPIRFTRLDVNQIVHDVVRLMEFEARRHEATIHLGLAADLPAVLGDRIQIEQVLTNLVKNSLEAMQASTRRRRVRISTSELPTGQVQMSVRDQGPGLPSELRDRAFQPYFTTKPDGMGLGLAISRAFIEAHRGRLWINAGAVGGAEFLLTLPGEEGGRHES